MLKTLIIAAVVLFVTFFAGEALALTYTSPSSGSNSNTGSSNNTTTPMPKSAPSTGFGY